MTACHHCITILCGGLSRRMGTDKALLQYQGETLLSRHIRLAQADGLQVHIADGGTHYPNLPADITVVQDILDGREGPLSALAGALTAVALSGAEGTWLMPVDTLITPTELYTALRPQYPAPVIMIVHNGRPQPLFAWYSTALLPRIEQWLHNGVRQMMPLAAISNIRHVVMPEQWTGRDNFNTLEAWQHAQQCAQHIQHPHNN